MIATLACLLSSPLTAAVVADVPRMGAPLVASAPIAAGPDPMHTLGKMADAVAAQPLLGAGDLVGYSDWALSVAEAHPERADVQVAAARFALERGDSARNLIVFDAVVNRLTPVAAAAQSDAAFAEVIDALVSLAARSGNAQQNSARLAAEHIAALSGADRRRIVLDAFQNLLQRSDPRTNAEAFRDAVARLEAGNPLAPAGRAPRQIPPSAAKPSTLPARVAPSAEVVVRRIIDQIPSYNGDHHLTGGAILWMIQEAQERPSLKVRATVLNFVFNHFTRERDDENFAPSVMNAAHLAGDGSDRTAFDQTVGTLLDLARGSSGNRLETVLRAVTRVLRGVVPGARVHAADILREYRAAAGIDELRLKDALGDMIVDLEVATATGR